MKKQNVLSLFSISGLTQTPAFLFLIAVFLCGAAAGSLTGVISTSRGVVLAAELTDVEQPNGAPLALLAGTLLWIAAVLLAAAIPPGGLFLSAVVAARAFVLSFSVAALLGEPALETIWLSLKTFGLQAMVSVPCLLVAATAAFCAALEKPRGMRFGYLYALGRYRAAIFTCTLLSACSILLRFLP